MERLTQLKATLVYVALRIVSLRLCCCAYSYVYIRSCTYNNVMLRIRIDKEKLQERKDKQRRKKVQKRLREKSMTVYLSKETKELIRKIAEQD